MVSFLPYKYLFSFSWITPIDDAFIHVPRPRLPFGSAIILGKSVHHRVHYIRERRGIVSLPKKRSTTSRSRMALLESFQGAISGALINGQHTRRLSPWYARLEVPYTSSQQPGIAGAPTSPTYHGRAPQFNIVSLMYVGTE